MEPIERFYAALTALTAANVVTPLPAELVAQLDAPLPRDKVKYREQAGETIPYVDGHYVTDRLNKVFGYRWSFAHTLAVEVARYERETKKGKNLVILYEVQGTLTVPGGIVKQDVGLGVCDMRVDNPATGIEKARKEAVTDALKRCAKSLGPSFGLALYDKARAGVGLSTTALGYLEELGELDTAEAVTAWMNGVAELVGRLDEDERQVIRGAVAGRRRALRAVVEGTAPAPAAPEAPPTPTPPPTALAEFNERLTTIELPGEAVAVWMKHAAALSALPATEGAAAWSALLEQTKRVGKMSSPGVWIRKCLAEEDARHQRGGTWTPVEEAAPPPATLTALDTYRSRVAATASIDLLLATHLELAPSVAAHQRAAGEMLAARAAALGAPPEELRRHLDAARGLSQDPAAWATVAAVLGGFAAAATKEAVGAVVRAHGAKVSSLPAPIKDRLNAARSERLGAITAGATTDVAAEVEAAIRAARSIPALDALAERVEREHKAGRLTADQARALAKIHETAAMALEQDVAA